MRAPTEKPSATEVEEGAATDVVEEGAVVEHLEHICVPGPRSDSVCYAQELLASDTCGVYSDTISSYLSMYKTS